MYIVYYTTGSYDDFCRVPIFVTKDENKANSYKDRFNYIRDKWRQYYFEHRDELKYSLIEEIIYYNYLGECYVQPIQER